MVESSGTLRDADLREAGVRQYARVDPVAILTPILGVFGCLTVPIFGVPVPVPLALVCGIVAIKRIRASKGGLVGSPVAVAGMVLWAALLAAGYYYNWARQANRQRGMEESTRVVQEFFDFLIRGSYEDAYALLSSTGKEQYVKELAEHRKGLQPLGRLQGVQLQGVEWTGPLGHEAGKMFFNLSFEKQLLLLVITMVQEDDQWRIEGWTYRQGAVETPPPAKPGPST